MSAVYRLPLIVLLIVILLPSLLFADTTVPEPFHDPYYTKGMTADPYQYQVEENVDPFSGNLSLVHTDLFLPGDGGLDLKVMRVYNSAIWNRRDVGIKFIGNVDKSPVGIGWSMHMGIVRNPSGTGSANANRPDNPIVEMADGSRHVLYRRDATTFITREYWLYENIGTGKWKLTTNEGIQYVFENNSNAGYTTVDGVVIAQATSITHPNDSSAITITYDKTLVSNNSYLSSIDDSNGRTVSFSYSPIGYGNGYKLSSMRFGGSTYHYSYSVDSSTGFIYLITADPPTGSAWSYSYESTLKELDSISYPTGGTIDYRYTDTLFDTGGANVKFRVVTNRIVGGRGVSSGSWSYSYSPTSTTISGPGTTRRAGYYNWADSGSGNVWRIGLPKYESVSQGGTYYEKNYSWSKSSSISDDDVGNANWNFNAGMIRDTSVYVPQLSSMDITKDGKTYSTSYSGYDSYGNPSSISESGDASLSKSISYWHNTTKNIVYGKPSLITIYGGADFPGTHVIDYSYTSNGEPSSITIDGVTTNYSYSSGNLASKTDANGKTTSYSWSDGEISKITYPDNLGVISRNIDSHGKITSETRQIGSATYTTSFGYDSLQRLTSITPPTGYTKYFSYASNCSTIQENRGAGTYTKTHTFDGFGKPTGTQDSKGVVTTINYDATGLKEYEDSNVGDMITYDYFGRITSIIHKDSSKINYAYSTIANEPNTNVRIVYEDGQTVKDLIYKAFSPDDMYLVKVTEQKGANAHSVNYEYNIAGKLTRVIQGSLSRSFGYNANNFLVSEVHPERTVSYARDSVGNVIKKIEGVGDVNYSYDGLNRLVRVYDNSNATLASFAYDGSSNRTSMSTPTYSATYSYDGASRLIQKSEAYSGKTYVTDFAYNNNDVLTDLYYPNENQSTRRHITYAINSNNEVAGISGFGGAINNITYDKGRLNGFSYSNGVNTNITYNSRNFVQSIKAQKNTSSINDLVYAYDNLGNTVSIVDNRDTTKNQSFAYDELSRLVGFNGSWGNGSFSYDTFGNRLTMTPGMITNYNYTNNRLASAVRGSENALYGYDTDGFLNYFKKYNGAEFDLTYDKLHNLSSYNIRTTTGQQNVAQYEYDADGMRIFKSYSNGGMIYHYGQNANVLSETDISNLLVTDYVYLDDKLVAKVVSDDIPPVGEFIIQEPFWINYTTLHLMIWASDNQGVDSMIISNDGVFDTEVWEPYAANKTLDITASEGQKKAFVKYRDVFGNESIIYEHWVFLDTTPPISTAAPNGGGFETPQTVVLSCADNLSGCLDIFYCLGADCTQFIKYTSPIEISVSTDLKFYSKDWAENIETVKASTFVIEPCPNLPIKLEGANPGSFTSLQAAYDAAASGDTIKIKAASFTENLNLNRNISITFSGGYNCEFTNVVGNTWIFGTVDVNAGVNNFGNLEIK